MQALNKLISSNQKRLVKLMIVIFLLAPVVNIVLSFMGSGVESWYEPNTLMSFLKSVSLFDYVCLSGFVLAALVLLFNKGFSFYFASFILVCISLFGVARGFHEGSNSITEFYLATYVVGGTLLNILVICLLLFLAKNNKSS